MKLTQQQRQSNRIYQKRHATIRFWSGFSRHRSLSFHPSVQNSILRCKKRQPFSEFTIHHLRWRMKICYLDSWDHSLFLLDSSSFARSIPAFSLLSNSLPQLVGINVQSVRLWEWENREKLLLMVTLAYTFLLSLLDCSLDLVREWLLRHYCHRTGKKYREAKVPLYRIRWALSRLWSDFRPVFCFSVLEAIPISGNPHKSICSKNSG